MELGRLTIVGEPLLIYIPLIGIFDESDPRTEAEIDQDVINFTNSLSQFNDIRVTDTYDDVETLFNQSWLNLRQLIDRIHQVADAIEKYNLPYGVMDTVFIKFDGGEKGILTINSHTNLITLICRDQSEEELIEERYPLVDRKGKI